MEISATKTIFTYQCPKPEHTTFAGIDGTILNIFITRDTLFTSAF